MKLTVFPDTTEDVLPDRPKFVAARAIMDRLVVVVVCGSTYSSVAVGVASGWVRMVQSRSPASNCHPQCRKCV